MGELSDSIKGIGPAYERRLEDAGIVTIEDLQAINIEKTSKETGLSSTLLKKWHAMALFQRIEGIDSQFSEALVRVGIDDFQELVDASPQSIFDGIIRLQQENIIPDTASLDEIREWQKEASRILTEDRISRTPEEARVVWETMTCRGIRNYYESKNHACRWFSQFGPFHAFDIPKEEPEYGGEINAFYTGSRYQVPELLSGCRKAPIMSIGLNPNLRAVTQPWRVYPYLDDIQQYAHHFRFRTTFKYSIEREFYDSHLDNSGAAVFQKNEELPLKKEHVSMYMEYDKILQAFVERAGITDSGLSLGEDVSYYNFVACHSPRWDMDATTEGGIVNECYMKRQFFLKQLSQSMPGVVMLFGKPVMRSFVSNFRNAFKQDNVPDPDETYSKILEKNNFVMDIGGKEIRVIFSPHPTGARPWYVRLNALEKIVDALHDEYVNGRLIYDNEIKHFKRSKGACKFCSNDLYFIGKCRYVGHFEEEDTRSVAEISSDRRALTEELISSGGQ
jgi:hypothetical protein